MKASSPVVVFGAYGHTGKFVVSELKRRNISMILAGRDEVKLRELSEYNPGASIRVAPVENTMAIDNMISGSLAVINCAGPFIDTAAPIAEAAMRARIPYFDLAAEQAAVLDLFDRFNSRAAETGTLVVPAMGFYGGLSDLIATATMKEWNDVDEVIIAVGLDGWHPTLGTRATGQRNAGPRFFFTGGRLQSGEQKSNSTWEYPAPLGTQPVVRLGLSETIIIPRHIRTSEIRMLLNIGPLRDIENPATPPPVAVDELGRSSQIFIVDVVLRRGDEERRTIVRGQDIYAVTAPIVAEGVERVINGLKTNVGVLAPGQVFEARSFLTQLQASYPGLEIFEL